MAQQYNNQPPLAKLSLWTASKEGKKYIVSGVLQFEDGTEHSVYIFHNESDNPKAPDFYGFVSGEEREVRQKPAKKATKRRNFDVKEDFDLF